MSAPKFLEPKSLQATDATRTTMVRAFDSLLAARTGHAVSLDYWTHFTKEEYDFLQRGIDDLLEKGRR